MTNAIEQSKREMYKAVAHLRGTITINYSIKNMLDSLNMFEGFLEDYLELLRQDREALHETARKRFEDIQSLEKENEALQMKNENQRIIIEEAGGTNELRYRLAKMTEERDSLRSRMQAYEARSGQASTSGQTSVDRASCATLDGKTAAILGAVVDARQIVSDWAVYGYKAKKQMKKLAYAINNNPELHSAMLQFEKGDGYGTWFINNTQCMHRFMPAFPRGEQCVFCGVGK